MQRGRAIVRLRVASGDEFVRAVQVLIGKQTDADVLDHYRANFPNEEVVNIAYELLDEPEATVALAPETAAEIAQAIVGRCRTPRDLPDVQALKIAILRESVSKWQRSRQAISDSTGVSLRTMHTLMKEGSE